MLPIGSLAGRRALVTGGLGFIGSTLARALVAAGADVTIVDNLLPGHGGNEFNVEDIRRRVSLSMTDIRDEQAMAPLLSGQNYVFNLAAQTSHVGSMRDPALDLAINATAHLAILEFCRRHNPDARIVYASTRQLYGRPDALPVDESHPVRPPDVNGINKFAAECYHLLFHNVYGLHTCALRLTNTYGPRMRVKDASQMFVGIWIRCLLEGSPLKVFGTGEQLRDFTYVDDVVRAMLLAVTRDEASGRIYNLGHHEAVSLKDLAATMVNVYGCGAYEIVPFPEERKAVDIGDYVGDYSRIRSELGWEPQVGLAEGMRRTLDYYRDFHDRYLDPQG